MQRHSFVFSSASLSASLKRVKTLSLENTLSSIESGIKNKSDKIELYDVINLSLIIELKRENFTKVLTTISDFYQEEEDYEMCAKIQKLKKKI